MTSPLGTSVPSESFTARLFRRRARRRIQPDAIENSETPSRRRRNVSKCLTQALAQPATARVSWQVALASRAMGTTERDQENAPRDQSDAEPVSRGDCLMEDQVRCNHLH